MPISQLISLGSAAAGRFCNHDEDESCSACRGIAGRGNVPWPASADEGLGRGGRALPGSSTPLDWQLPMPPVRFPLRDALLAFNQDDGGQADQEASQQRGPLKVYHTQKSRAVQNIGRLRHSGQLSASSAFLEELPQPYPKPPPDIDRPKTPPKAVPSKATILRRMARRSAQEEGAAAWPLLEESQSAPSLGATAPIEIRDTWTSAARAVLSHSQRFPGSLSTPQRPVKEWVARGLGFTDQGLGIGDRFDLEVEVRARRSPGPVYEQNTYGNVALWLPDSSMPTKQPCSQHVSTEVHRMGARWREGRGPDRQQPEPGSYEIRGFVEEMQRKMVRRPKGRADAPRVPPGDHAEGGRQ